MVLILDTDPGIDDMLALMLLLTTDVADTELRMISLTYGNCSLADTLRNVLSLFHIVQKENEWRKKANLSPFTNQRPIIHLGSSSALPTDNSRKFETTETLQDALNDTNEVNATDVHGSDGLAGIHSTNPEYDSDPEWFKLFYSDSKPTDDPNLPFKAGGNIPAWEAILDVLRSEPEDTVTIASIGPLTNLAKVAEADPVAFSKVKRVLSMGGALRTCGNVTPMAEFNVLADPLAAARVYALTSKNPEVTLPTGSPESLLKLPRPLKLTIFPLDITNQHTAKLADVHEILGAFIEAYPDCVLAKWVKVWYSNSFANYGKLVGLGADNANCELHDPVTAAYAINMFPNEWSLHREDFRVEHSGQWCMGKTVVDDRGRARSENNEHDIQKWLTVGEGNNVDIVDETPFVKTLSHILLERITKL